jgi:hypothetical protein
MTARLISSAGFRLEEVSGLRGIGGAAPIRLTRISDSAAVLLHQISPQTVTELAGVTFQPGCPDFSRPFVTRFAGILEQGGSLFLVEPLPPAVPLLDVWTTVLQTTPSAALGVLRALNRQLQQALDGLHAVRQRHGAVCVDNVVLATSRCYGLLQAWIETADGWVCVRPLPEPGRAGPREQSPVFWERTESARPVVRELITIAMDGGTLSPLEQHQLETFFNSLAMETTS